MATSARVTSLTASRPNEKWVADSPYLRTWSGFVYLAFILDCFSRTIVGWQLATHQLQVTIGPDGGIRFHLPSGDLLREERQHAHYLSPEVELISYEAFKRVCYTCFDGEE